LQIVNFFFLLFFIQDKALAALAIEDKKRQYAAAEKYLEDVLHSALATS
jgi:HAUS augmin-like complex subunit 1